MSPHRKATRQYYLPRRGVDHREKMPPICRVHQWLLFPGGLLRHRVNAAAFLARTASGGRDRQRETPGQYVCPHNQDRRRIVRLKVPEGSSGPTLDCTVSRHRDRMPAVGMVFERSVPREHQPGYGPTFSIHKDDAVGRPLVVQRIFIDTPPILTKYTPWCPQVNFPPLGGRRGG